MYIEMITSMIQEVFRNREFIAKFFRPTEFLNYNPLFLLECYNNETAILGNIPYQEVTCWIGDTWTQTIEAINGIQVEKHALSFVLEAATQEIRTFQIEALKKRNLKRNSTVIRLNSVERIGQKTYLTIQRAKYSDQAQSNLAMDWEDNHALKRMGINTLRTLFLQKYSQKLPPFSDKHFANTIGISVVLFYKNSSGNYVPYFPRREKSKIDEKRQLAVFTGGEYHCTASGAAEWFDTENSFVGIFAEDMYREIEEEVEIKRSEISVMIPVALCREFLRGGKPQVFFAGITTLSEEEIAKRRKIAIAKQVEDGYKVEIQDGQLYLSSMEEFSDQIHKNSMTLEAYANLHYAARFYKQYEKNG